MQQLRKHGDELLSAQRWQASYAARPELDARQQAEQLYHLMCAARYAGDREKAREYAAELKPLLWALPA